MKFLRTKANIAEIKGKLTKHAPELMVLGSMIGTAAIALSGWIVADLNRRKLDEFMDCVVEYDPQEMLIVHPELLREVREDSATLTHWIDGSGAEHFKTIYEDGTEAEHRPSDS